MVGRSSKSFHLLRNQHNPKTYTIRYVKSLRAHAPNQALLKNGGYQKLAAHMLTSYGTNIIYFFFGGAHPMSGYEIPFSRDLIWLPFSTRKKSVF